MFPSTVGRGKEGYVDDQTRSTTKIHCCPKTTRSFSLRPWKRMHIAACLPSAGHQKRTLLCPRKTVQLLAMLEEDDIDDEEEDVRASPSRLRVQSAQTMWQSRANSRLCVVSNGKHPPKRTLFKCIMFGVGSIKMNRRTTRTVKYRDTCSGHSRSDEHWERQRYSGILGQ